MKHLRKVNLPDHVEDELAAAQGLYVPTSAAALTAQPVLASLSSGIALL